MQLNRIRPWLLLLSLTTALLAGCARNNEVTPDPAAITGVQLNDSIYSFLKEWYLWNDQLPAVNTALYNTPQEFVRALRLQPFDRWSYIEDTQTFNQYFVDGQFAGHGFGMRLDGDRNLRVSFVYRDSPMGRQGVTRGYKILRINGQDVSGLIATNTLSQALGEDKVGVQNRFLVEDLSGGQREFTIPKENVTINAVLHYEVKEVADKKVGYLAYNTFIDKSKAELDEVFRHFQQQGIQELVLDVRYNGGGSLGAAQYLSGLIGASRAGTGAFATLTYNSQKQASNRPYFFVPNGLDAKLERVFVITSRSSASASEAVINGLRPFMEVITIGDDTHGKPVGMNAREIGAYTLVAIMFKVANANGEADYFEGIRANAKISDNLAADFGDVADNCLQEALHYIQTGRFSGVTARRSFAPADNIIELPGFRAEIGAF